ncbi:MAG: hypothetical protein HIU93_04775 [Acidobacteria bacterium]|nr:hypothetical protein [Acidobacteriota bacterium]MBW4044870.1 hypothetical protein [Acidobacteriota bacterium]
MRRRLGFLTFIAASAILTAGAYLVYSSQSVRHLHAGQSVRFEDLSSFHFFGGDWTALSGTISDGRSGRGDLAVTTDSTWGRVHLSGDVRFDNFFPGVPYGDAGFVLRVTQPDVGVDSFHGYYAGIRIQNQTLVFGKAEDHWSELKEQPLTFAVTPGGWYHLSVDADKCRFVVRARPVAGGREASFVYDDPDCFPSGAVGLRLFYVQASWRNLIARG